jgi:lambda repressor-like predicted transcriptional regulator
MAETADELRQEIAEEIERLRWSMRQVSLDAGLSEGALKHFINGKTKKMERDNIVAVAKVLGWPAERVLKPLGYDRPSHAGGGFVAVPLASVRVAAGMDTWEVSGEPVSIESAAAQGRDLVAMLVTGECMAPAVEPGDLVLIDRNERLPIPGDLVVLATDHGPVLKRYDIEGGMPILRDGHGQGYRPNGARLVGVVFEVRRRLRRVG